MASRNLSVHTMSIYVIHRTNYANTALHIVLTKKSVMTSSYVNITYFYLSPCSDISVCLSLICRGLLARASRCWLAVWITEESRCGLMTLSSESESIPIITTQWTPNICITFVQCWTNVADVGLTLYKCYTNVLCLLGDYYIVTFMLMPMPCLGRCG